MRYTNTPATVLNAWVSPETKRTVYLPTVLRDVKWQGTRASKITVSGLAPGDAVTTLTTVIIWPARLDAGGKAYLPPKAFARLSAAEAARHWTLSDAEDRMVKGAVDGLGVVERLQDVTSLYDDVIKIVAVTENDFGPASMRHWYVTGTGA